MRQKALCSLTIHQESSHNPQVQGHDFRRQEEQKERKNNHRKAGNKSVREVQKDGS